MKAWAVVENGEPLKLIDLPMPTPRGTEVLLEVTHCGLCHTDIHMWEGHFDLGGGRKLAIRDRGVTLPLALGHEVAATVVGLGPDAKGPELGAKRIVFPWIGCGRCEACLAEQDNMCAQGKALGLLQHGGHSSHVMVPHPRYLVDPGTIPLPVAATLACSGITAYSALRKVMPLAADEPVVVIGAGGLGLTAISLLRALAHRNIVAVDVSGEKLAAASEAGASQTVLSSGGDVAAALVEACGRQPRAIVDFVNGAPTAALAFQVLRKGGTLVQVGLMGGELVIPLALMTMRALTVQGSYVGNLQEFRELIELVQSGAVTPIPIEEVPVSEVNDALQRLTRGKVTGRLVLCGCAGAA